jgi:hypothetical protein
MLRQWGFDFVAAVVHRVVPVAEEIVHMRALAVVHKVAPVAVVAHREVFAVDMGNFEMEVVLHTGWVVAPAPQAPFRSWCKSVGRR